MNHLTPMNRPTFTAGGIAALVLAASYIIGFVMWGAVLGEPPDTLSGKVAFVSDNLNILTLTTILIYHIPGVALVLLVLGLRQHLGSTESVLANWSAVLGFIWAGIVLASGMIYVVALTRLRTLQRVRPAMLRHHGIRSLLSVTHSVAAPNSSVHSGFSERALLLTDRASSRRRSPSSDTSSRWQELSRCFHSSASSSLCSASHKSPGSGGSAWCYYAKVRSGPSWESPQAP